MTSPPATFTILTKGTTCKSWMSSCKPKYQPFLDTRNRVVCIVIILPTIGVTLKKMHNSRNRTVLQVWIPSQPIIWLIIIRSIPV